MSVTLLAFFFSANLVQNMHLCSQRQTDRQTDAHTHTDTQSVLWGISLSLSLTHTFTHSVFLFLFVLLFFSAVRFHDCGRGGRVHFECSQPTGFRIEITGEALALWKLQPSLSSSSSFSSSPLLVIARDVSTHEQWQTQIRLGPSGGHESQV